MARTEDLRVIKTKNALHNAFFAMLSEMELEDITINNLCDRAGIRRATFYKHFDDKIDFITYIIKDVRVSFDSAFNNGNDAQLSVEYYVKYTQAVVAFLSRHEQAIAKILASSMRSVFIETFIYQNHLDTMARLERSVSNGLVITASPKSVAGMIVGGVFVNVINWFEHRDTYLAEDMIKDVSKLIEILLK